MLCIYFSISCVIIVEIVLASRFIFLAKFGSVDSLKFLGSCLREKKNRIEINVNY